MRGRMQALLQTLTDEIRHASAAATNLDAVEETRIAFLGKQGKLTQAMKQLGQLDGEARKEAGAALNLLKGELVTQLNEVKARLEKAAMDEALMQEHVDVTLPAREAYEGNIHPISRVIDEITTIFAGLGFARAAGPEIEDDFHNFTALNIPESHPARQMHDTFYLDNGNVLRTHTSSVQIRTMQNTKPPLKIIAAGRTYRCDSDMTHTPMFHQIEGLYIDKDINFAHLKGVLEYFLQTFFGLDEVKARFRPSYFPFTEPSAEVDIGCKREAGNLQIGQGDDWLEVLGCGMVHPNVLSSVGIDPDEYQGYAFGLGVERLAMLKYGMSDLRQFFGNDIRWLDHYGFTPHLLPSLTRGI